MFKDIKIIEKTTQTGIIESTTTLAWYFQYNGEEYGNYTEKRGFIRSDKMGKLLSVFKFTEKHYIAFVKDMLKTMKRLAKDNAK